MSVVQAPPAQVPGRGNQRGSAVGRVFQRVLLASVRCPNRLAVRPDEVQLLHFRSLIGAFRPQGSVDQASGFDHKPPDPLAQIQVRM